MRCEDFRELIQGAVDATSDPVQSGELQAHAESCRNCKTFYESTLALHRAMYRLPRMKPSQDLVAALNRIDQLNFVPVKVSWGPDIRLAIEMLIPVALPYVARAFSSDLLQQMLEMVMLALGLTLLGITMLKPHILGGSEFRLSPEEH